MNITRVDSRVIFCLLFEERKKKKRRQFCVLFTITRNMRTDRMEEKTILKVDELTIMRRLLTVCGVVYLLKYIRIVRNVHGE